jgi:signal transduction histidine kinase
MSDPGPDSVTVEALERERSRLATELLDAELRRDELLAMLAHELRGPLAAVSNAVRLLDRPDLGPAEAAWCREVAGRQVRHLTHLLDNLLDMSRLRLGKIQLQIQPVDLGEAITRALTTARPRILAHRHQVESRLAPQPLAVAADPHRLDQILYNLLQNALKFTPDGGHIEFSTILDTHHAILILRDDGVGIPSDLLPRIFEPYVQGPTTIDRPDGGLGLGLALVRSLAQLHGAQVSAASEGRNRGSTFELRWPVHLTPEPLHST